MNARGARIRDLHRASPPADADILARVATGEIGALGELYDRHQAPVRRFLSRATSDAEDVDDLVQATFLTAAKTAARYDGRASCRPWLIGIAVQLLKRRRTAFGRLLEVLARVGMRSKSVDPRDVLDARSDVEHALSKISEPKRIALLMAEVEEMSGPEIATALGVPVGTVWTRLHAARRELREILQADRREASR